MSSVFDSISSIARLALAPPHPATCVPYFKDRFHFPLLKSFILKPVEYFFEPSPYTKGKSKKLKKRDFPDTLREIIVDQNIEIDERFRAFFPWSQLTSLTIVDELALYRFEQPLMKCPGLCKAAFYVLIDLVGIFAKG